MNRLTPFFANEATAAALLDMKKAEFCRLVDLGHLPRGREIAPGCVRWEAETLRKIGTGEAIDGRIEW